MPRIIIVHGWADSPDRGWLLWLRKECEARGYDVVAPQMPEARWPRRQVWIPFLQEVLPMPNEDTYFVGHSLGCQAICRYLESLPDSVRIGGALFVAGFLDRLAGIPRGSKEEELANDWLHAPLDLQKVKNRLMQNDALFSDNDAFVPLENSERFKHELNATIHLYPRMGHFTEREDGFLEMPIVRDLLFASIQKNQSKTQE